jgi:hypothetical protein
LGRGPRFGAHAVSAAALAAPIKTGRRPRLTIADKGVRRGLDIAIV